MKRAVVLPATALTFLPGAGMAHDAFGDLGPFYGGLLHPAMAPAQILLLTALGLLLARQPLASVRAAFPALVCAGAGGIALHAVLLPDLSGAELPLRAVALCSLGLGALALWGARLPLGLLVAVAVAGGALAGVASDPAEPTRDGLLGAVGAVLGLGVFVLLAWGAADLLQARIGRIAGAVAASWLVAIAAMAAVLPG